jgi:hypothetical protein
MHCTEGLQQGWSSLPVPCGELAIMENPQPRRITVMERDAIEDTQAQGENIRLRSVPMIAPRITSPVRD